MTLGTATCLQGNALNLPLPDASVDLICTSPPYFGLRSYQDNGMHYAGQIGSEATPAEFLDALIAATREMVRVLKPSGSIFVNLGDKYAGSPSGPQGSNGLLADVGYGDRIGGRRKSRHSIPNKSLMGMPWRYAIRCIDQLGLILRAEIIWNKPNGLPESVTDRVRRSHENWFHFTVQPRYYAAVDEIREEYAPDTAERYATGKHFGNNRRAMLGQHNNGVYRSMGAGDGGPTTTNPLGKLPGSVWTIPTQPLEVPPELGIDHFAAYPMEWPRRIIQGWSPTGICTACGEGRRPVMEREPSEWQARKAAGEPMRHGLNGVAGSSAGNFKPLSTTITGYMCGCPTPTALTQPAICLDPFGGTGTTALVAKALGRTGITIDLSADYCRLAEWRCNDPGQLAAALQVEKPDVVPDGQMALFE